MSARVCPSCRYNVVSSVVTACPNCGATLPASLTPSSSLTMVGLALILVAGAAAFVVMREPSTVRRPSTPPVPPSAAPRPASPATAVAGPSAPSPRVAAAGEDKQVERLIALLDNPESAYSAGHELAKLATPGAQRALMTAYDRRDFAKMAGAAAFYAHTRPPDYEKVLVNLLHQSRDLAVAQDLILSRDPKLAEPARKWAAEQGFKLVRSAQTPTGVTWISVSEPSR